MTDILVPIDGSKNALRAVDYAIARAARRLKCESIVMGTRGMGTIGNLFLGSVATRVIHLARIPVTLIK